MDPTPEDFARMIQADADAFDAKIQTSFDALMARAQKNFIDTQAMNAEMKQALTGTPSAPGF